MTATGTGRAFDDGEDGGTDDPNPHPHELITAPN
jgi:hypothetical protein